MGKTLVIVESPAKAKKIQKFLGGQYKVMASFGHIRDLVKRPRDGGDGIERPDYILQYEISEGRSKRVVADLRKAAKAADAVILASDPDREGEAIAWHLSQVLGLREAQRITFSEITARALNAAIAAPQRINFDLVRAQEARRALDRIVGYGASRVLGQLSGQGLSAGRVQTPAIILVVEREEAIESFQSVEHYGACATFRYESLEWTAQWVAPIDQAQKAPGSEARLWRDKGLVDQVVASARAGRFQVVGVENKERTEKPPAPFTTSTLQQAGSVALGFRPKRTMELAQKLYQVAGVITYHRTDEPNLSDEAIEAIWDHLRAQDLGEYVPVKPRRWKAKEGAQEAHEACRPVAFDVAPDLSELGADAADAKKLYDLIWQRAVACQMVEARYAITEVALQSTGNPPQPQHWKASGKVMLFAGWRRLTQKDAASDEEEEEVQGLPALEKGQSFQAEAVEVLIKRTSAPPRFTEASLVKKLEELGIGRPSTYAAIMETIVKRGYAESAGRKGTLTPTPTAREVVRAMRGRFAFAEYSYTRDVEAQLDRIANGENVYRPLLAREDRRLAQDVAALKEQGLGQMAEQGSVPCPQCGGRLMRRPGKKGGHWWGCLNYPTCDYSAVDRDGKPAERAQAYSGPQYQCPTCGGAMQLRSSAKGAFWGCGNYPKCTTVVDDRGGVPAAFYPCPQCGQPLRRKTVRKGPNKGARFWACASWPAECEMVTDEQGRPGAISEQSLQPISSPRGGAENEAQN